MPDTNIGSAVVSTDEHKDFTVAAQQTDGIVDQPETEWINQDFEQQYGYFKEIPELNAAINAKATWTIGKLARTAWHDRSPVLEKAYATGADGFIYQHETGVDDNGAAMACFVESFDMEIGEGEELMHVDQLIPDFLTLEGSIDVSLTGKKYPGVLARIEKGPYTVSPGTRKLSTRMRARQVALKVSSSNIGDKWRMSHWRGRAGPHGRRG